jgi:hypothetical protein
VLHFERKLAKEYAEREAAAESLWTDVFDDRTRRRLLRAASDSVGQRISIVDLAIGIDAMVDRRTGISIGVGRVRQQARTNFEYCMTDTIESELMPSVLEATVITIAEAEGRDAALQYQATVNGILNAHRISFEMIDGSMIEKESQELHAEVVAPTLRLLSGRGGWEKVEEAYQDALGEIADGKPGDAITDAARALEEALGLMGAEGNTLGKRIKSARDKGIIAGGDSRLTQGIIEFAEWASALRGSKSDAHSGSDGDRRDAWLAVHVVGALILHLAA